jgi:hypothetical protein
MSSRACGTAFVSDRDDGANGAEDGAADGVADGAGDLLGGGVARVAAVAAADGVPDDVDDRGGVGEEEWSVRAVTAPTPEMPRTISPARTGEAHRPGGGLRCRPGPAFGLR